MVNQMKIVLYNPAISSLNMGDHIIFDAIRAQLERLLTEAFIVEVSTHLPVSRYLRRTRGFDYRFVCGSNLLRGRMNRLFRQWDVNILNAHYVGPCVLVGTGWWQYGDEPNYYTKRLYRKILSSDLIHSVRDAYTEMQLRKMGFANVLNTACPTMWDLTEEHCDQIPQSRAKDVVCTITDYNKDWVKDRYMIKTLCDEYDNVYLWLQGLGDYEYYQQLDLKSKQIHLIPPNLDKYDSILEKHVDYVGTRLHAGIRALQKKKRTTIIAIDNRAIEKQSDFNLNCLTRSEIERLPELINSDFPTNINIPIENIVRWKEQFLAFSEL